MKKTSSNVDSKLNKKHSLDWLAEILTVRGRKSSDLALKLVTAVTSIEVSPHYNVHPFTYIVNINKSTGINILQIMQGSQLPGFNPSYPDFRPPTRVTQIKLPSTQILWTSSRKARILLLKASIKALYVIVTAESGKILTSSNIHRPLQILFLI